MNVPETGQHLLLTTLADLKLGINKINDKLDTVTVDVAGLKEKHPFYATKLDHIESRLGMVEDLSGALKEKQNIIYAVAGAIAAFVTFLVSGFKTFITFLTSNGA